jgi:hypothetical protein
VRPEEALLKAFAHIFAILSVSRALEDLLPPVLPFLLLGMRLKTPIYGRALTKIFFLTL